MNKNINLCKLLKGHEGETFYSPLFGDVVLKRSDEKVEYSIYVTTVCGGHLEYFTRDGLYFNRYGAECVLFPSKDQRDWNEWAKEQKPKVPKTWSELIKERKVMTLGVSTIESPYCSVTVVSSNEREETLRESNIEKSALALLKIYQLIEVGYGGNITNEEWGNDSIKFVIRHLNKQLAVDTNRYNRNHIAFHTKEQAEEFISYEENVQLLKDYYML